jgi:hypothetical protein
MLLAVPRKREKHPGSCFTQSAVLQLSPLVRVNRSDSVEQVVRIVLGFDTLQLLVVSAEECLLKVRLTEVSLKKERHSLGYTKFIGFGKLTSFI